MIHQATEELFTTLVERGTCQSILEFITIGKHFVYVLTQIFLKNRSVDHVCVFLDLIMPSLSGFRVKEKPSLSLHKRIALSLHRLAPEPSKSPTPSDSGSVLHLTPPMPKARTGRCQHRKTASTGNWGQLLKEYFT